MGWVRRGALCALALWFVGCSSAHEKGEAADEGSSGDSGSGGGGGGGGGKTGAAGRDSSAGSSATEAGASGGSDEQPSAGKGGGASAGESGDAGSTAAPAEPTVYRVTELYLRDPHFFLGRNDITDKPFLGTSLNGSLIPGGLTMDYDEDGFVDVSMLAIVTPADPEADELSFELIDGHCDIDTPTHCAPHPDPGLKAEWTAKTKSSGACLAPLADTTTAGFDPEATAPQGPCFVTSEERDLVVNLGGVSIALTSTKVAARFDGDPPSRLVDGLMAGFVTQAKAESAELPDYLPLLAGTPLSDYLRPEDRDTAQSPTGDDGYWVYINFVAEPVDYSR